MQAKKMHYSLKSKVHLFLRLIIYSLGSMGKQKIFCIGCNKTGTTSLAKALSELGVTVGIQRLGEWLAQDWACRDFRKLHWYCRTAQAFQDIPFSWPFTFQALDQKFPGSKFILTIRNSAEEWYESLIRFHGAKFADSGVPTAEDLKNSHYVYPGFVFLCHRLLHNTPEEDLYNKTILINDYHAHNDAVLAYFRHRPQDLLVLNVAEPDSYKKLCDFLRKPYDGRSFPWENKHA